MENKQVPHSIEAEQAVIASLILDPEKLIEVEELLQPHFFYIPTNEKIYEALIEMRRRKMKIDLITIKEYFTHIGILEEVGGIEYIADLYEAIPTSENALAYAQIIHNKFVIRETIKRANDIMNEAYNTVDSMELVEHAEKEIFSLSKLMRSDDFVNWGDLINETYQKIAALKNSGNKRMTGLHTGFSNLDYKTSGLQKSDLIVIAARPSVGKTAFALNLARNVATNKENNNASVAFFSLEMSAEQLLIRLVAAESRVEIQKVKTGNLDDDEQTRFSHAMNALSGLNMFIDDTAGIKIGDLKSKCRKLKLEKGLDLVVIDYLQLITTSKRIENRQQEVSEISRELKALAKEINVPVIALSQLSRGVEQRVDKKPMMSDIRESGAIEQDADIIMMLYRPEYYANQLDGEEVEEYYDGKTELNLVKHRNGETGEIEFKFEKSISRFVTVSHLD